MFKLCSIFVLFDQYHVGKKSNKTLIEHNPFLDLVRLIRISTFYVLKKWLKNEKIRLKTTYSCIVKLNPNNCRTKHCRTSQQSPTNILSLLCECFASTTLILFYYWQDCDGDGFVTCDDFAMIHWNGGYNCSRRSIIGTEFWNKFSQCQRRWLRTYWEVIDLKIISE